MSVKLFYDPVGSFFTGYFDATGWPCTTSSEKQSYRTVNTEDFDIVPKASYVEKQIAAKEEEKKNLERTRDMTAKNYDDRIAATEEEIKKLKKQLK